MIYTITLDPYIEKRIHGKNKDEVLYEMDSATYHAGGVGLRTSLYLKAEHMDSTAYCICGHNITNFLKNEFDYKEINIQCMEIQEEGKILTSLYEEDHILDKEDSDFDVTDTYLTLFNSIVSSNLKKEDVCIFEYDKENLSIEAFSNFYQMLRTSCDVTLVDVNPIYYKGIKDSSNVLILDEKQYLKYRGFDKVPPLSGTIAYINQYFTPYAKIFIYALNNHDFILFFNHSIYRASCDIKEDSSIIYKEAIFTGLLKCYEEDGDMQTLVNECLAMSVGTSLSDGMIKPLKETQALIKDTIELRKI